MTKKILISLGIIGIVAAVTVGLTTAYFTDEEPIKENIFQAGTLDIQQGENDLGNMTLSDLMEWLLFHRNLKWAMMGHCTLLLIK